MNQEAGSGRGQLLFSFTTFLSALLLFSLQPMIARAILPWFGGAAGVWNCAQFFFQGVLLLGYLYAHLSITRILNQSDASRRQGALHGMLILGSLLFLPVIPAARWKPTSAQDPALQILLTLAVTVGLPYLVLSSTSPLVAAWYSRVFPGRSPYPLFAWSNFGSFLGLLGYPLLLEPNLGVRDQIYLWSAVYFFCGALLAYLALLHSRVIGSQAPSEHREGGGAPGADSWFLWLALPTCTSVLLVAITHYISTEIAAVPLLWVIPLSLYLLSYIAVASSWNLYRRWLFYPLFAVSLYGIPKLLDPENLSPMIIVVGMWVCLAILFMVCHGELWQCRPEPQYLSHFYLAMSVGGACGSFLVAYLAPHTFDSNLELSISIFVCPLLVLWSGLRQRMRDWSPVQTALLLTVAVPLIYQFGSLLVSSEWKYRSSLVVSMRNFYGTAWVAQVNARAATYPQEKVPDANRILFNGRINHGCEYIKPDRQGFPTGYFSAQSGIGRIFSWYHRNRPRMNVGIVGLGVGTLAAYGRAGDEFALYELDPKIEEIAKRYFYFVPNCPADKRIVLGDARLSLENEPSEKFDLLVIDAFTGDSIPVHLLTEEAFRLYRRVLKPDGILALHVSNLYLDLPPVVAVQAEKVGLSTSTCMTQGGPDPLVYPCVWAAAIPNQHPASKDLAGLGFVALPSSTASRYSWTDDSSNLLKVIKPNSLPTWTQR